ncbi:MAG: tetratricopeptide repeat protein, partial [Myxococcota bacterium]
MGNLGILYKQQGRMADAEAAYTEALAIARDFGDRSREGILLGVLGNLHIGQGRIADAEAALT